MKSIDFTLGLSEATGKHFILTTWESTIRRKVIHK